MSRDRFELPRFLLWVFCFFLLKALPSFLRGPPGPMILVNLVFFLLVVHLSVLAHEIGHALVARAVGLRPFMIQAGTGPLLVDRVILGVIVQIRAAPSGGLTFLGARSARWLRLRLFPMLAAGLIVNAALLLGVFAVSDDVYDLLFADAGESFAPWSAVFFVNAVLVLGSLIPATNRNRITGRWSETDGYKLLRLLWLSEEQRRSYLDAYPMLEGTLLLRRKQYREAIACAEAVLAVDPTKHIARLQVAEASILLGRYEDARAGYVAVLAHPALATLRPILANNAAWASVMLGREELLAEADACSAEAFRGAPERPFVLGTRGAVLAQLGNFKEATDLLLKAYGRNDTPQNRALNACFLAMIAARSGEAALAQSWLGAAARLDPRCSLLDQARKSVAAPGASGPLFTLS